MARTEQPTARGPSLEGLFGLCLSRLSGQRSPAEEDRCPQCGEWRGFCLDPSPQFAGYVMEVHCRCANDNRCAACGDLLHARKLNANAYNEADGHIWHTPGFSAFGHVCRDGAAGRSQSGRQS
jgi:hypothetical protein